MNWLSIFLSLLMASVSLGYTTEPYATADDGAPLYQDVYTPNTLGPWPQVIVIHGGGFYGGSRHGEDIPKCCTDLAQAGFLVKSIDYRLCPPGSIPGQTSNGEYPLQTSDITKAIIAARNDSRGDHFHVFSVGGSAGGTHAVVGATLGTQGYDKFDAAVALSGPFEFSDRTIYWNVNAFANSVARYCGTHNLVIQLNDSPVNVAGPFTNPLLLINTQIDNVDQSQSYDLMAKLNPGQYQFLLLSGSGHSFHYWDQVSQQVIAFLQGFDDR